MQTWTKQQIRDKVRKLTGRKTAGNLSDADLDRYINEYLINTLSLEVVNTRFNNDWFTSFTCTAGQFYLDDNNRTSIYLRGKPTVTPVGSYDNIQMTVIFDYDEWKAMFPDPSVNPRGTPTHFFYYATRFYWNCPCVGGEKMYIPIYPYAPISLDYFGSSSLSMDVYGRLISYGAAIDILMDHGEFESAKALSAMYSTLLNHANRAGILMTMGQPVRGTW